MLAFYFKCLDVQQQVTGKFLELWNVVIVTTVVDTFSSGILYWYAPIIFFS